MNAVIAVAVWFFTGWLGWRIFVYTWTHEFDLTRQDRAEVRWMIITGPANLIASLLYLLIDGPKSNSSNPNEIIYPRKDS